jgi:hypothetical protein
VDADPATTIPPRKQVLVYRARGVDRLHAATISADSLSGIPWLRPIECDSCRTTIPLAEVDSIEVGDPSAGFGKSVGLGYGLMLVFLWFTCTQTTICTST